MDEEANIVWARALEQAGVHVVYGLIGYKTHSKAALVVRRENAGLRRYVHLGTGNYNPGTARIYSDLSLFTAKEEFGADATSLFNLLTGYSKPMTWRKFKVAPLSLKGAVLELIEREAQIAAQTGKGRIVAKMNSLSEPDVIKALYRASQAGVQIDLVVRGVCVLRPGIPGVSDRIRVISIVDRFLEHARIWHFEAGGKREMFLASADWMQRNFVRRVEIAFPVEDPAIRDRIFDEILATSLADNVKARILRPDGTYERAPVSPGAPTVRSQERFMALARRASSAAEAPVAAADVFPNPNQRRPERRRKKRTLA
jgi:polyphosphate kinase